MFAWTEVDNMSLRKHFSLAVTLSIAIAPWVTAPVSAGVLPEDTLMTFSIDFQGPTIGLPDSFSGIPINEGAILTPFPPGPPGPNPPVPGPLPPPGMMVNSMPPPAPSTGRDLGLIPTPLGYKELDALSYGGDPLDRPLPYDKISHVFSVDEFAIGLPGSAVRFEGALGAMEASADTFIQAKIALPTPPIPGSNAPWTDGNGVPPSGAPGVGLIEPNPPTPLSYVPPAGPAPDARDPGDNLDAVDFCQGGWAFCFDQVATGPIYFSLDSGFTDPLEAIVGGPNTGTALANGFVGGDVLVNTIGPPSALYAAASTLGLDIFGPDTDDLDALKLAENGIDGYQESIIPFDWLTGTTDMLLYSVRRNSAIIGSLDSIFGIPIEEGDILTTPCPAGSVLPNGVVCAGGPAPGIFTAAEWLGLATVRSGTAFSWGIINPQWGVDVWADDLNAYDQVVIPVPGTFALLLAGFGGLAGLRIGRRRTT